MIDNEIKYEFSDFGRKMRIIGICVILMIIPIVNVIALIVILIYQIKALSNIKKINLKLEKKKLRSFYDHFLISFIIILIGITLLIILTVNFMYMYNRFIEYYKDTAERQDHLDVLSYNYRNASFGIMLIGVYFVGIIQFLAWSKFKSFFRENINEFPAHIANDTIQGCGLLKISLIPVLAGAILGFAIFLFGFGLGIIAIILQVLGYFRISHLRDLQNAEPQ